MKMKNKISALICMIVFLLAPYLKGQETRFYMPLEIKEAYEKGTRSYDGKPGPNYWQNTVDYDIAVEVIPSEKKLVGTEKVTFYNNSPDLLTEIYVRLYHDAFRKANPRANRVNPDDITEGVEISRLTINGDSIDLLGQNALTRSGTNMIISLNEPLASGATLALEFDWTQLIPATTIRTGAYDSTSFFISYWYPQIAVYDDIFGWDDLAYDFDAEFYNNLGNFDVRITAPTNFTVLATGVLQNPTEILPETQLNKYQQAQTSEETIYIITPEDLDNELNYLSGTWHYKADKVSDFSFCLSDHYCWDAGSQKVEDRDVLIHTYYLRDIREEALEITAVQQKSMKHFSEDMPGVPYPYPEFCTFIRGVGGGGMETPMMANNAAPGLGVTVHEMFHTYFPMYVRTNEKRFAWMDEGWANFTDEYIIEQYFNESADPVIGNYGGFLGNYLGTISDLPMITSTQFTDNTNYGASSYSVPAFIYAMLYEHLGKEVFQRCYSEYIIRWAEKSPTPYDFFYTFEDVSGEKLDWLWKPWFFEFGNVDVSIESFQKGKLSVINKGTRPVPILIDIKYKDGTKGVEVYSPKVLAGKSTFEIKLDKPNEIASLTVNKGIPDTDIFNNFSPSLEEQFNNTEFADELLGAYQLNEVPATFELTLKRGIVQLTLNNGFTSTMIPSDDNGLESVDGLFKLEVETEEEQFKGLIVKVQGQTFTANKLTDQ